MSEESSIFLYYNNLIILWIELKTQRLVQLQKKVACKLSINSAKIKKKTNQDSGSFFILFWLELYSKFIISLCTSRGKEGFIYNAK